MNCQHINKLLDAYADDELDVATVALVDSHLESCDHCTAELERITSTRSLNYAGAAYACPPGVATAVREAIELPPLQIVPVRRRWMEWAVAAAVLLSVVAVWQSWPGSRAGAPLAVNDLVAAHLRSMQADHLLDVVSTDQHTVRPWFNGKLDFSPHVKDFAGEGFPLEGGRLDYFAGHPAAALVYRRDKHIVNVFIWPASDAAPVPPSSIEGFNVITWKRDGLNYSAVSDLQEAELSHLAHLLQAN